MLFFGVAHYFNLIRRMDLLFLGLGGILYLAVVIDIVKTTLSLRGGGWLTSLLSNGVWALFFKISGGNGRSRLLEHTGYFLLVLIVLFWVISLWLSFFLLLLSQTDSIISSSSRLPADAWEKFYYAGFALSTLGVGDFVASSNLWRVLTDVYAFTGLVLITTSVTYFVPVLSGVTAQRNLGIILSSLGQTPQQLVLNSWDGNSFERLIAQAADLSNQLIMHSQNHKAYPIIHYFHTPKAKNAILLRIATLCEALFIISYYVRKEIRPDQNDLSSLHTAMDNYLEVVQEAARGKNGADAPEKPDMKKLIEKGLVDPALLGMPVKEGVQQNRLILASLVEQDGWSWEDVIGNGSGN